MLSNVNINDADNSRNFNFNGSNMDISGAGDYWDPEGSRDEGNASSSRRNYYGSTSTGGSGSRFSKNQQRKKDANNLSIGYNSTDFKQLQMNLPEDMRISKLLRRLCSEDDYNSCIDLCRKLSVVISEPSNSGYIRKSFDILADSVISVIKNGPLESLNHVTDIFGMMGYVVRVEFATYKSWIVKTYKCSKSLKKYMMNSLKKTISMDASSLELRDHSAGLLELLKDYLENVDSSELFMAITDVIIEMCANYPKQFEPHFSDIVDIVVGWHLETDQKQEIKNHCSKVLQSFHLFWKKDSSFTLSLLSQFIEDISACEDDLRLATYDSDRSSTPDHCFGSLVDAYNTVIKCLFTAPADLVLTVGKETLETSFGQIIKVGLIGIQKTHDEDIILPVNECVILFLDIKGCDLVVNWSEILEIIKIQIVHIPLFSKVQITSLMMMIIKYIDENKSNLSEDFVDLLWNPSSEFLALRYHLDRDMKDGVLKIFHKILNIKNVSVLQGAYKYMLNDIEDGLAHLDLAKSQCAINFNLLALSTLATANNSLIVMWALQPSILEVLITNLRLLDLDLWSQCIHLHFAVLKMAFMHSSKNHNFISTSSLLKTKNYKIVDSFNKLSLESISTSPTSEHFTLIMAFLNNVLECNFSDQHLELILDWCHILVVQTSQYFEILNSDNVFNGIIKKINKICAHSNEKIALKCSGCIDSACSFGALNNEVYKSIAEVCCIQMCSINATIRDIYSDIFAKLPLRISLEQVNQFSGFNQQRSRQVSELQHWYISTETSGDMRSHYFKDFINKIGFSKDAEYIEDFLKEVFMKSWFMEKGKNREYSEMALKDMRCLIPWAQWEAAQFCVNNKLRTPIGKPQETFLKIESIIKENARILALKEKSTVKNIKTSIANQKHSRILLGFLEALEKAIYNASDGTAFSMPVPEKPARTFFHVNAPTCAEWFNRIRTAVDLVALHCMESEMVVRYSEAVLKELIVSDKSNEPLFEHTLMSLVWALLRNGESDTLYGLYAWSKKVTNKKFPWAKMAAEQAAGHRETAANGYMALLVDSDENLDRHIRDFIVDQINISLLFTGRWEELHEFLKKEETEAAPRATIPIVTLTSKQVESMMAYEATKDPNIVNLCSWEMLDTGTDVPNDFSCHKMICLVENSICNIMLENDKNPEGTIKLCSQIVHNYMQDCLLTRSREYLNQLTIINHIAHKTIHQKLNKKKDEAMSLSVDKAYGSFTLMRLLSWAEFFDDYSHDGEQQHIDIRLDMVSIGRKENNFMLCKRELEKYYNKSDLSKKLNVSARLTVDTVQQKLIESMFEPMIWNENMSRAVYEHCKLLYSHADKKQEAIQFAAAATMGIKYRIMATDLETPQLREREARFLLTLADWVQPESEKMFTPDANSPIMKLVTSLPDLKPYPDSKMATIFSSVDTAVGKFIQYSVHECPELAKAWGQLGSWCYKWGKKMVELKTENKAGLHNTDIDEIKKIIPSASCEDIDKIVTILNQHQVMNEDEDIGLNETSSTELMESLLISVPILSTYNQENLYAIIEIWRQAHRSVYGYYEVAADAYFKFLHLATKNIDNDGDSSMVTATLRLLRLIVKHALGLKEVLEEGLASTPTSPWKVIIPQLFSRLNHHEPYVRKRVSELLCRVARDAPHLIIFPAVVGSVQEKKRDLADISIEELEDSLEKLSSSQNSGLAFCFNALLDILSKDAPETVNQVQLLVHELRRISLLWDELWIVSLQQIYSEYTKRFTNFENDLQKAKDAGNIDQKKNLFIEKHNLLMRPLIFVLEQLYDMTSRSPETNHERYFQEKYLKYIEITIGKLKEPLDLTKPTEGWSKFKTLFIQIQQKTHKRTSYSLKMMDISPILAKLSSTAISMPGIESTDKQPIFIKSVDNLVLILPTKTKPKKLMFYGSNGRRYTYLFKGLEDLHLDERIMQFLSIANLMMTKSVDCNGNTSFYRAHHYSVIPLGPRSGLINWVDDVVPIFSLYKKWQQREATMKKDKQYTILRPSEMYYKKLTPLLQKHGLKSSDNRKDWPLQALKQVMKELEQETPRDLLSKELWCQSTTASAWRQVVRNYSLSMAVMSVIGYVIGLGDRHLDNVLVKLSTGEIVHIDYNVCFEKGKTLRVPEKVPFRLTPNLVEALGITGIEGTFRLACEHVLKSLKKGRETLLTLLEAFVYDPLVDWAVNEDGDTAGLAVSTYGGREGFTSELRQAKKQLEREVNRDTLAIRFSEIKSDWNQNRDDIYQQIMLMQTFLKELEQYRKDMSAAENNRSSLSQQIQMIREAESLGSAIGSHPLNTLSQRYGVFKKIKDEHATINKLLTAKTTECDKKIEDYRSCKRDIESNKLAEHIKDVKAMQVECSNSEFEVVKEFLENSAQSQQYMICDQFRREVNALSLQQASVIKHVFETLCQYGSIIQFFPRDYENHHRLLMYTKWCRMLTDQNSALICRDVVNHYRSYMNECSIRSSSQQVLTFSYQLKHVMAETSYKLNKLMKFRQKEMSENSISIEKIYENALSAVELFLQQENGGRNTMNCVALKLFSDLNQRFLTMELKLFSDMNQRFLTTESASASSDDNLLDLKLNDNWFLDELYLMSAHINNISQILFEKDEYHVGDCFATGITCLMSCTHVYEALHNLNRVFLNQIISETMQGIISENASVIGMISGVSNLQQEMTLQELLNSLNMHLQCMIMNLPSPHQNSVSIAEELKEKLGAMTKAYEDQSEESLGSKLFLEVNKLFNDLDSRQNELIDIINNNVIPLSAELGQLDQIKESKLLAVLIFNRTTSNLLQNIFIVKRLQALIEFFTLSLQMAYAFKGSGMVTVYDDENLSRPIRKFIADHVYHYQLGVGPQSVALILCGLLKRSDISISDEIAAREMGAQGKVSLSELCVHGIDLIIKKGQFSSVALNHANSLWLHLNATWKKMMGVKLLQGYIGSTQIAYNRLQMLVTAHSWLHEEIINAKSGAPIQTSDFISFSSRSAILMQLQKYIEALTSFKICITKASADITTNTNAIVQRLKWAVGANPDLYHLLNTFEKLSVAKREYIHEQTVFASIAVKHCAAVLNYELERLPSPGEIDKDQEFLSVVARWEKSCLMSQSCSTIINSVEVALVELLDPEGQIDHIWLNNVSALIDDMTDQVQSKIAKLEKDINTSQDNLHMSAHRLRALISNHHKLASDIRSLLKMKLKMEASTSLREYLTKYKAFLETVSELHSNVLSKDFTDNLVKQAMLQISKTLPNVHAVFDDLFLFENDDYDANGKDPQPSCSVVTLDDSKEKVQQTQKEQKRNAYAVSVWRRIRMKLEGRDPDPNRRCVVQEQVDWMIREAMDADNLAILYEGWTPWV